MDAIKTEEAQQCLRIQLNDQYILIPLLYVELIIPLPSLKQIAIKDDALCGILNYHGHSTPIYSLANLIKIKQEELNLDTPIVLCRIKDELIGLIVSDVDDIVKIRSDEVQHPSQINQTSHIQGIVETQSHHGWLLNLSVLFKNIKHVDRIENK